MPGDTPADEPTEPSTTPVPADRATGESASRPDAPQVDDVPEAAAASGPAVPSEGIKPDRAERARPAPTPPTEGAPKDSRARRILAALTGGGTTALLTWLLATPAAFVLTRIADRDPFANGASTLPVTVAFGLVLLVFLLAVRWSGDRLAGVAAGLSAAWVAVLLRSALNGTPFGFGGLGGDMGRMSASATRYTQTLASSDTLLPGVPSEYPPLYAWLIGRASVLLDQPAWRLLADFEVLFLSASVLGAFLLWRRLVHPWVAVAIPVVSLVAWADPRKAFEVLTLALFVPWALEVFARPPRRRMHWLPAGLIGGFIAVTYQAWVVYAVFGLVALIVIAWRTEPDRWAYLRRLVLVAVVAFVVSSWYVVPFVRAMLTEGGQSISDMYVSQLINMHLLPFLEPTASAALQFVGLAGLIWLWRSVWWARPLLLIVLGAYGYRLLSMLRYLLTGHTGFMHYTARLYGVVLAIAGVLVVAHLAPIVLRRLRPAPPRLAGAAALAVLTAWSATVFTFDWMPDQKEEGLGTEYTVAAFTEPLPGGGYPRYAPEEDRRAWFPVYEVQQAVEKVTGPDPRRMTLSADDRLYSYLPWPGYIDNARTAGSTLSRWDDRHAELATLAGVRDPDGFARASADTRFGPIDIFVLRTTRTGLAWLDLRFDRAVFDPTHWTVVDGLPGGIVVAVRK
ncbi:MAG TPA: arabinofuranosyltransferase [Micromonospora sp.]